MSESQVIPKESRNLYSTLTVCFASLGSLTYGYSSSIIATTSGQTSFLEYFSMDTRPDAAMLFAVINGLYQAGGLIGCILCSVASDKLGRRAAIFIGCIVTILGGALQAGAMNIGMFIAGRFFAGFGTGMLVTLIPVWQSELAAPHSRGLLVGLHGAFLGTGYAIAGWVGYAFFFVNAKGAQWRIPLALQIVFPLALASGIFFIPESPRWLLQHGKEENALAVCIKIRANPGDPDSLYAKNEFKQIKAQHEYDVNQPSSWLSIAKIPSYRRRALIGFSALFLAQATGTQVINNYGAVIYGSLGFSGSNLLLLSAGWITVAGPCNLLGAFLLDRFGRRTMMIFGFCSTALCLVGVCITVAIGTATGNKAALGAAVFFIYAHVAFQTATNYYGIATFLVQEFRLHRKCDSQLREIGLQPDSEIDIARRDVYGFQDNYSNWWMNYVGRLSLPLELERTQRAPFRRLPTPTSQDPNIAVVSEAFYYHCELSKIGRKIVFCNHSWRARLTDRVGYVSRLRGDVSEWRASLPETMLWPQPDTAAVLLPSVAALIAISNAYIIELLRPYVTNTAHMELIPDAMEACITAADEIIALFQFIRDCHGVDTAPLTSQQILHVAGTMLVLQASGVGDLSKAIRSKAHRHLSYAIRWFHELAEIWPASGQMADSLKRLEEEYCL